MALTRQKLKLLFSTYPLGHLAFDWRKRALLTGPTRQEPFFSRDPLGEVNFVLESAMGAGFDAAKINLRYLRYPISSPAWRLERELIYSRDPLGNEILCWSQLWVAAK
ncbi:hypothetical protein B296_00027523, partial [Ensete ventricosum]